MSSNSYVRRALFALACLSAGCSVETTSLAIVPREEVSQLPSECGSFAQVADEDVLYARAEGDAFAIVIDTPDGSCVASRERVVTTLSQEHRYALAARIEHDFAGADPSPHPDLGAPTSADPSPHPDKPNETASADPSPHPDKDDNDDVYAFIVVVPIVGGGGGGSGGEGAPPPAPPPVPANKPD